MSKMIGLCLPLLLLACHKPEATPRITPPLRPGPTQLELEISTVPGVAEAELLKQESLAELKQELASWNPVEVPAGSPRSATVPRLRVKVQHYKPKPAGSPFATIGVPGLLGLVGGWAVVNSTTAISADASTSLSNLFGFATATTGLAALVVGIALESRKNYLERRRGYPLHAFKAQVQIIWRVNGDERTEKENFRSFDLAPMTRPMPPNEAAEPGKVRQEMMRALAVAIHQDVSKQTGWGKPEEAED